LETGVAVINDSPLAGPDGLADLLRARSAPQEDLPRFIAIFEQICQALAFAHEHRVIHRDLKPANVMVGAFGEVQLMDWGLGKVLPADGMDEKDAQESFAGAIQTISSLVGVPASGAGTIMGTRPYIPPEQARGESHRVGKASDVFGLGAILCEILTGLPPFTGANKEVQSLAQEGNLQPAFERLDRCGQDEKLVNLAKRCLAPQPEDRPAHAGQVAAAVRTYLDGVQERLRRAEVERAQAEVKAGEEKKRRRMVIGLAAAILLLVLGGSGAALWYLNDQNTREIAENKRLAEAANKLAFAEQDVRQNLNQALKAHVKLLEQLKKPSGVQELLRLRWDLQIQTARDAWQRAKDRADNAEGDLDPELADLLRKLDADLARHKRDYDLAWQLEKIRLDTAIIVEGKFNYALAEEKYPGFFGEAGLPIKPGRLKKTARLIQQSVIKEQLLAALEHWALILKDRDPNNQLIRRLWEVVSLVDPDPWANKVRKLAVADDRAAIEELADELQRDQGLLGGLSPAMLLVLAKMLPEAKQESWLRMGQSLHRGDFWCNFALADFLRSKKKRSEATGYYSVALAIRPNTAAVYNNLGVALLDQKKLPAAIDAFKQMLAIDDQDAWAWNNLGAVLRRQNKLPAAIKAYKKALAIDDKNAEAWYNLGAALREQKKLPAAIDAFKKALAINDKLADAWSNLGIALHDQKNLPAAIEAHKKALAVNDKNAAMWSNLGTALHDHKDLPAAIEACKKALAIDANYAPAWNNLGIALRQQKNVPAAIKAYKKALVIDREYADAWHNLGAALYDQKNVSASIEAYKKSLAIADKNAEAWHNLGVALYDQKKLPAATHAFKKALAIDDKSAAVWTALGVALSDQKEFPAAIEAYKKSLAIDDKNAEAWYNLGKTHQNQRNLPAAIEAYQKAIHLLPDYAQAHCNLGIVLRDQGDFAAGLKALQKGDELGRRQPGWPYPSAAWVKHCQQLVILEQKVPTVLKDGSAEAGDLLAVAELCQRYKKRYRDSAALFAKAFAKEPKAEENLDRAYRYNAACAAALAAAGKGIGADQLDVAEKNGLRQQALQWLQADLTARTRYLEKVPLLAMRVVHDMQHWQKDPDLVVVRDDKELDRLADAERTAWQKFWTEVEALSKRARAAYGQTEYQGQLSDNEREQSHPLKMTAGKTYMIDMASAQFDTYLRLEDDKGKVLAENDDISPQNLQSQIIFSCKQDGTYRIVATSFQQVGRGTYVLIIREFQSKR
jgi:tetratricopeptide (TPR) repeat protein